jgi:hypothetical protein
MRCGYSYRSYRYRATAAVLSTVNLPNERVMRKMQPVMRRCLDLESYVQSYYM